MTPVDRARELVGLLRSDQPLNLDLLRSVVLMLLEDFIAKAGQTTALTTTAPAELPGDPKTAKTAVGVNQVIAAYIVAWQARYKTKARPAIQPMLGGLKVLLKDYTAQELVQLVQAYCQMTDDWFEKKKHDFETFRQNVGKVAISLDAGEDDPGSELARAMTAIKSAPRRLT